jgi:hypothetical protein
MVLAAVGFEKFDEANGVHLYRTQKSAGDQRDSLENLKILLNLCNYYPS